MVESIKELRRICYESREGRIDWWARNVSTRISIYITKILLHTPVTANQVSFSMIIVGLIATVLFGFGDYMYSIIGGLLMHFIIVLDGVDGEIARYRKKTSLRGSFIDRVYHILIPPLIFVGITFGVYWNVQDVRVFLLGFSASLSFLLLRTSQLEKQKIMQKMEGEAQQDKAVKATANPPVTMVSRLKSFIVRHDIPLTPSNTKVFTNLILLGAIFDRMDIILVIYGILPMLQWVLTVSMTMRAIRD